MEKVVGLFQRKNSGEPRAESQMKQMGNSLIKGTMIALAISFISLFLYAIVLANTEVQENTMPTVIIIVTAISLLAGSMIATRKMTSKGIITGACIGLIYMGSMYVLSSVMLTELTFGSATILMLATGMLFAAIGGIIGVILHK